MYVHVYTSLTGNTGTNKQAIMLFLEVGKNISKANEMNNIVKCFKHLKKFNTRYNQIESMVLKTIIKVGKEMSSCLALGLER